MGEPDDRVRAAYTRATLAAYRTLAERGGGTVVDEAGLMLASGPHPHAVISNAAFRVDSGLDGAAALRRASEHYAATGFQFAFYTSADHDADIDRAAAGAGWRLLIDLPGMIVEATVAEAIAVEGVQLRFADGASDTSTFGRIAAVCFADDEDEAAGYRALFSHGDLIEGPDTAASIASVDGQDAAAAWVALDGVAGLVGWVGTLPDFRRRGLGSLVTRAVTNEAFRRGARIVALQASPQGLPVYERMGYRTITAERVWIPPR